MRVIEQARLWFREGTSDKVYEVDLVEVAPGQHVVNFRYGRRGTALRDGTKTATPLPAARAKAVYDKLVAEKLEGGYQPARAATAPVAQAVPATATAATPPVSRAAAIVQRLLQGNRGDDPLGPAVWRAGDLDLHAAEPALLELLDAAPPRGLAVPRWQHVVLSALARCATTASLPRLERLAADPRAQPNLREVARLAIARVAPDRGDALARALLPVALRPLAHVGAPGAAGSPSGELARALEELLATDPDAARIAASALYALDVAGTARTAAARGARADTAIRAAILALARVARLDNREAQVVRVLLRGAELARDGELYALLARRIDKHRPPGAAPGVPFGPPTRAYWRRRIARVLRRLGRVGSPDYVRMASAVLLSIQPTDAQPVLQGRDTYDEYAGYHAMNDILFGGGSPRYERAHHGRSAWRLRRGQRPGGAAPVAREERFPALWDAAPAVLWQLVAGSRVTPVVEFAVRALRGNPPYLAALPDDALAVALAAGHPLAQQLAFDVVRGRPMTLVLARAGLDSSLMAANDWVLAWVYDHLAEVARDAPLLALLVTGPSSGVRAAALAVLARGPIAPEVTAQMLPRAIATLLLLGTGDAAASRAAGAAHILLTAFGEPLRALGHAALGDLIAHPLAALGELAGELLLRRGGVAPADLIDALLASPHARVRTLGGRLLALVPVDVIAEEPDALVLFSTSANAELREATRGLVGEVARRFPDAGRAIAAALVELLRGRLPEGAPAHILSLLRAELAPTLPRIQSELILRLLGALSPHARDAAALLLPQLQPDDLGLDDVARLAHHEVAAVRRAAWELAHGSLARYRLAPVALARLVDSPWADTREVAAAFIRDPAQKLTADAIIAICDSIRPEVQDLGTQLLRERFAAGDAGRYVVRLSEHPSTNLQLLVSGLLEHHVAGSDERLAQLAPYLVTVLSQVNRGRVAKERVIALLRREAARSPETAAIVAPILDRQSATIAITQKHPLIATMVEIKEHFPGVALPITVVPPRGGQR